MVLLDEERAWIALWLVPRIGPKSLYDLAKVEPLHNIVESPDSMLLKIGFKHQQIHFLRNQSPLLLAKIEHWLAGEDRHIITFESKHYPPLLKQTVAPPPVLFVQGCLKALLATQVAIVGSRHASMEGLDLARKFACQLSHRGVTVTSGLALGVDGHAHAGALEAGAQTIAVLGSGLDRIYPKAHTNLAERIINNGAVISEFVPWADPKASHFPRRNRVISGLSQGVLIVEAAEKSGSLITARYAVEQDREVFVLPSSLSNPNSRGSNALIQQGAKLVQNVDDILEEITIGREIVETLQPSLFDEQDNQLLPFKDVLANLDAHPVPIDILAQRTHIAVQDLMGQLLELELLGLIVSVDGGYIRKKGNSLL